MEEQGYESGLQAGGHIALKVMIKNPGDPPEQRHQVGAWWPLDERFDTDKPLGADAAVKETMELLLKKLLLASPPSKQG